MSVTVRYGFCNEEKEKRSLLVKVSKLLQKERETVRLVNISQKKVGPKDRTCLIFATQGDSYFPGSTTMSLQRHPVVDGPVELRRQRLNVGVLSGGHYPWDNLGFVDRPLNGV